VSEDKHVIVCNYTEGTGIVAKGAKAYVVLQLGGNLPENIPVVVRSRGGRWVRKWERVRRLDNFRLKTLPPEHPRYSDDRIFEPYDADEALRRLRWAHSEMTRPASERTERKL